MPRLFQIAFSHNCLKVRLVLRRKGLAVESVDVHPLQRTPVLEATGQPMVPALVDGGRVILDSTAILLHLEAVAPEPRLIPAEPRARTACLFLEDWADESFMASSRRVAYRALLGRPGHLESWWFADLPEERRAAAAQRARRAVVERFGLTDGRARRDREEVRELAAEAMAKLAARRFLVGDRETVADLALAALSAPLWADAELAAVPEVAALLAWGAPIVGEEELAPYRR